jgi:hypothetical protein
MKHVTNLVLTDTMRLISGRMQQEPFRARRSKRCSVFLEVLWHICTFIECGVSFENNNREIPDFMVSLKGVCLVGTES